MHEYIKSNQINLGVRASHPGMDSRTDSVQSLSPEVAAVSNDLSALTAAHGWQSSATVPASAVSRYLMAAFLTLTGGAETFLNWTKRY